MPAPSARLAIDLSGSLIRVVSGTMGSPMRSGTGATPPGAIVGGKVVEQAAVVSALKQLLARTEITENRALIAVSDGLATFRVLDLPKAASERDIAATLARELPLDPERIETRWVDIATRNERRMVYAAAWDRGHVRSVTDAVRAAGVDPTVVELKSAAMARAVSEPSCILVDLASDPAELVLIDGFVARLWHSVDAGLPQGADIVSALGPPLRSIQRFYRRQSGAEFGPSSPVLISAEQLFSADQLSRLATEVGRPVAPLPVPPRAAPQLRHPIYLACLGLIMRRTA